MLNLGFSIYLDYFRNQFELIEKIPIENTTIFTSLHIKEEIDQNYTEDCLKMIQYFKSRNAKIIADVSKITLKLFEVKNLCELQKKLSLDYLRLDFGFSNEEILEAGKKMSLVLNASTITKQQLEYLKEIKISAMYNYYPRLETGLDIEQVEEKNRLLKEFGVDTMIFISGKYKRKPLYDGLPTIELLRNIPESVAYIYLKKKKLADFIFIGDIGIDEEEFEHIKLYHQGIITLKTNLDNTLEYSCRIDSPKKIIRLDSPRSTQKIEPYNTVERIKGSITMDNHYFLRYQGEIQITRENLATNPKINVIGEVDSTYHILLDMIEGNDKIRLKGKKK